jgi:wyosine [tRNA(Phe)-imidazoG37] synthetase (radical SAM superfamily)
MEILIRNEKYAYLCTRKRGKMATFLFDAIIFGPVHSRRLGSSLGINLLPVNGKVCTFDCLYCECGLNAEHRDGTLPQADQVIQALETKLMSMQQAGHLPDTITFAGNGEPTLHPAFPALIDQTLKLRDRWSPLSKIAVLSNATQLHKQDVVEALKKIDYPILKLDSAFDETIRLINRPVSPSFRVDKLVQQLKAFQGRLIIQTLFIRGTYQGTTVDNTTEKEVDALIQRIKEIGPESIMIYTIDRETPVPGLIRIPLSELESIANKIESITSLPVHVAG